MLAERWYERIVSFVRRQGSLRVTAARWISLSDSIALENIHELACRKYGSDVTRDPGGTATDSRCGCAGDR